MLGIFPKIDRKTQSYILGPDACTHTIFPSEGAGKLTSSYGERKGKERNKVSKENTNAGITDPIVLSFPSADGGIAEAAAALVTRDRRYRYLP